MSWRRVAACLVACLVASLVAVAAFNLEARIPVIKNGPPMTFFGFSVALHQTFETNLHHSHDHTSWMLVGAPRGQNLQPATNGSGALWKCPITTLTNDCIQVPTDGHQAGQGDRLFAPLATELKDDQWMGVTVSSQGPGGKVLVCGHRYIQRGLNDTFRWGDGLCYTLKQNLRMDAMWRPCANREKHRGHQQYGYCQAGTAGVLTSDDMTVVGMPGAHTWRGTVFAVNVSSDFLRRDKTQYLAPVDASTSPVDKYSYLGMAVAYGRFFPDSDTMSYVGGAPRSKGTGQVVFLSQVKKTHKLLRVDLVLDGEQFSSQFGYTLCAMDVDNNGMTDLIVGAPFHFSESTGGAIYIYETPVTGLTERTAAKRIFGAPGSRFGYALADAGDLNKDGFNDLAVGAPFENGGGAVRIFLGSGLGLSDTASQVIHAVDMTGGAGIMTFGYALSGGVDMDDNGYPDLLVGSFCNDTVALLRSRPIVDIITKLEDEENLVNIDPSIIECSIQPDSDHKCVSFRACFKMTSISRLSVNLKYQLVAETFHQSRKFSRVRFRDGLPGQSHIVRAELPLLSNFTRGFHCRREYMFIKKNIRDIQTPVQMRVTYSLKQRHPKPVYPGGEMPDIDQFPILDQRHASRVFSARFIKNCGRDDICQSSLTARAQFDLPTDASGMSLLEVGDHKQLAINVTVTNSHESAYDAQLTVRHDPTVSFIGKEPKDNMDCVSVSDNTLVCYLGNPFEAGRRQLRLRFDVSGLLSAVDQSVSADHVHMSVSVNTTSEQIVPRDVRVLVAQLARRSELSVSGVARPEQSFYGGEAGSVLRSESDVQFLDQIGSEVVHTYEVYNDGPSTAEWVDVLISWPHQIDTGSQSQRDWLLYLTKAPHVQGDGECELDGSLINPLNFIERQHKSSIVANSVIGSYSSGRNGVSTSRGFSTNEFNSKSSKVSSTRVKTSYQHNAGTFTPNVNSVEDTRQKGGWSWRETTSGGQQEPGERRQTFNNEFPRDTNITTGTHRESSASFSGSDGRHSEHGSWPEGHSSSHSSSRRQYTSHATHTSGGRKGSNFGSSSRDNWQIDHTDPSIPLEPDILHRGSYRQTYSVSSQRSYTASSLTLDDTELVESSTASSRVRSSYDDNSAGAVKGGGATYSRPDFERNAEQAQPSLEHTFSGQQRRYGSGRSPTGSYNYRRYEKFRRLKEKRRGRVRQRPVSEQSAHNRSTRSLDDPSQGTQQDGRRRTGSIVVLDCERGGARCVTFKCRVNRLPAGKYALVHVHARLWNSSLARQYGAAGGGVAVRSSARLTARADLLPLQNSSDDFSQAETLAYSDAVGTGGDAGLPLWAIILAVLAGLLLLALLALLLWRLGFFQRRRPRPPGPRR